MTDQTHSTISEGNNISDLSSKVDSTDEFTSGSSEISDGSERCDEESISKEESFHDKTYYKMLVTFLFIFIAFGGGCAIASVSISLTEMHEYLSDYQEVELKDVRLYVLLFQGIGIVVGSIVIGPVYDYSKKAKKWYHLNVNRVAGFFSLGFYSLCFLVVPTITYAPISLFVNFFLGAGLGCVIVGAAIIPQAVWKNSERKSAAAAQASLFALSIGGASCAFLIGKTIKTYDEWTPRKKIFVNYFLLNAFLLIPSFLIGVAPPPRFFMEDASKKKSWKSFLSSSSLKNTDLLRVLFVVILGACFFSYSSIVDCLADLCVSYCEARGLSGVHATYIASIFFASLTLGRFIGIFLFLFVKSTVLLSFYLFSTMIVLIIMFLFREHDISIWVGIGIVGVLLAPCFAGLTTVPKSFGFELSAIELGLMLMPNGFSEGMAGFEGFLMTMDNDMFFYVSITFSVLTVILFVSTMILGYYIRKRNEKNVRV